nr:unnamed protein product [Callosobruchus chinensis]
MTIIWILTPIKPKYCCSVRIQKEITSQLLLPCKSREYY